MRARPANASGVCVSGEPSAVSADVGEHVRGREELLGRAISGRERRTEQRLVDPGDRQTGEHDRNREDDERAKRWRRSPSRSRPQHPCTEHCGERHEIRANQDRDRRSHTRDDRAPARRIENFPRRQRPECRGRHVAHRLLHHRQKRGARRESQAAPSTERRGTELSSDGKRGPDQQRGGDWHDEKQRRVTADRFEQRHEQRQARSDC